MSGSKANSDQLVHQLVLEAYDIESSQALTAWLDQFALLVGAKRASVVPANTPANDLQFDLTDQEVLQLHGESNALDFGRVTILLPHLRRVVGLLGEQSSRQQIGQLIKEIGDGLGLGVFVLDQLRVVLANQIATQIVQDVSDLSFVDGHLELEDAKFASAFEKECDRVRSGEPSRVLELTENGSVVGLVKSAESEQLASAESLIFILVRTSEQNALLSSYLMAKFELSAKETRLALGLASGASLDELAVTFHVSKHTLRAQLKSVFRKTQTHRQSALVRLILGSEPSISLFASKHR